MALCVRLIYRVASVQNNILCVSVEMFMQGDQVPFRLLCLVNNVCCDRAPGRNGLCTGYRREKITLLKEVAVRRNPLKMMDRF